MKPEKDLLKYLDKHHVDKAVLTTVNRAANPKKYSNSVLNDKKDNETEVTIQESFEKFKRSMPKEQLDHQDVIDLSKRAPDRFINFFWFNPKIDSEEEESGYRILENHFKKGFKGVKIHSGIHLLKIPRDIIKLASFIQDYNNSFPLYIHLTPKFSAFGGTSGKDIVNLAKSYPNLRIIVGHAGLAMELALELGLYLKDNKNVFFETSCSIPFAILNLIRTVGHKRVIFGSDSPVTNPLQLEIDKILCLPIPDEQKQDIFYNNSIKLFES